MKRTQINLVIEQLEAKGYVSRNWALGKYISRLGAIIHSLKKLGWEFDGQFREMNGGKDYFYFLEKKGLNPNGASSEPEKPVGQVGLFPEIKKVEGQKEQNAINL